MALSEQQITDHVSCVISWPHSKR